MGAWAVGLYVLAGAVIDQDRVQLSPQGAHAASDATAGHGAQAAVVVRVIDGDTIVVQVAGVAATVRLMGIDTPETQHPTRPIEHYGPEAAARTGAALAGMTVHLTTDRTGDREDAYGRWLRYVEVGGVDFNAALVREGYARAVRGVQYARRAEFIALEDAARSRGVGVWARQSVQ